MKRSLFLCAAGVLLALPALVPAQEAARPDKPKGDVNQPPYSTQMTKKPNDQEDLGEPAFHGEE